MTEKEILTSLTTAETCNHLSCVGCSGKANKEDCPLMDWSTNNGYRSCKGLSKEHLNQRAKWALEQYLKDEQVFRESFGIK